MMTCFIPSKLRPHLPSALLDEHYHADKDADPDSLPKQSLRSGSEVSGGYIQAKVQAACARSPPPSTKERVTD